MGLVVGLLIGYVLGVATLVFVIRVVEPKVAKQMLSQPVRRHRRLPPGIRRGERPDIRRIVLRPVNKDEPPSRVTQALFRQRPTRKLDEDD